MTTTFAWQRDCLDVYCISCNTQVLESGRRCPSCHTPTTVSRSVAQQGARKKQKLISVLGASGAGKTVYLGMLLDMFGKGVRGMRGIPNGAFSLDVQDQTITALEQRRFPEKTPSEIDQWNWIHCEAYFERKPKQKLDLITPDIAGEVLAHEIENPGSSAIIRNMTANSDAIFVLLDSTCVRDFARSEDSFACKLVNYIAQQHLRTQNERRAFVRLPLAIVLTKTDVCSEAEHDTEAFVKTNLPGLSQYCRKRFQSWAYFPASVVGTTIEHVSEGGATMDVPLHVQPRGIVEPVQWVIATLEKKWRRSW